MKYCAHAASASSSSSSYRAAHGPYGSSLGTQKSEKKNIFWICGGRGRESVASRDMDSDVTVADIFAYLWVRPRVGQTDGTKWR
jgi:hypothetical protein